MKKKERDIIRKTVIKIKKILSFCDPGHDWSHTERVWKQTIRLAAKEGADQFISQMAALLHDIDDKKFFKEQNNADAILKSLKVADADSKRILHITLNQSFSKKYSNAQSETIEFKVVQDADRLDAIGAIGIARAFSYGGYMRRIMYDPAQKRSHKKRTQNKEQSTINHFYDKLLLLKDKMNTQHAKKIAEKRHKFMIHFLKQFYEEWG